MNVFAFSLPMPPTANHMFATAKNGRRFKSKKYADWLTDAGWIVKAAWQRAGSPKFSGPLALTIHLGLRFDADISNRLKPIEDLLVKSIPDWPDDCWNDSIAVERVPEIDGARIVVTQLAPRSLGEARPIGEIIRPIVADIAANLAAGKPVVLDPYNEYFK